MRPLVSTEAWGVLAHGPGCRACRQTGYRGRVGVYELLTMSQAVRFFIQP